MSRFKKYERYKNSEILWTPIVPEHWNILPNKTFLTQEKKTVGINSKKYSLLSLTKKGVIIRDLSQMKGKFPAEFNSYKIVFPNRLILCLFDMDETPRTVGLSNNTGMITGAYNVLRINNINKKYIYYYYLHLDNSKDLKPLYRGLRKTIKIGTFLSQKMPVPPIEEQEKIVRFIEYKEKQINKLIRKQKRLIELLEEKKKTIITEAVTKGLDKNAPMKDSGIDWIGKMPTHWEVRRIKSIGKYRNGLTFNPKDICDSSLGTLVLRSSNINNGKLFFEDNLYVKTKIPNYLKTKKGDILICSRNGSRKLIGKNTIIDTDIETSFGAFMMIFRCNEPKYIYYVLNSNIFEYYLGTFLTSTINQLTGRNFGSIYIPYCKNQEEQVLITNYLDKACSKLDKIIKKKQLLLDKLEEYKKTLVSNAVTGQIDIRNYEIKDIIEDGIVEQVEEEEKDLSESEVEYANC